jgi:hypothetical protein
MNTRAIFAAVLFTILLIVVSVLPHEHTLASFPGQTHDTFAMEPSGVPCPLCDWLSVPHLPAPAVAPLVLAQSVDWQEPFLQTLICADGFMTLHDSPQRGPPAI